MSTATQIMLAVLTTVVFLVRLCTALYGARVDGRVAEIRRQRITSEHIAQASRERAGPDGT